ncbi:LacI family DNA-binding transcriptional regulator [Paracoccus spongiarum]|uniref:LacI family DNA-binding transcriptional regulator n=1 Tax=Paracoccus spongiarum TaxID=3064387 RepID=A0ABT9JCA3_9RHOB|nr:LacI family DNA-binding transcriptional regulator [Paracoccus sp. 2205BS29-5]MDP5307446.1 LacI family DNA-binding transcriptional regulator [Paracoccus sp. 2205BS29-5]
MGGPTFRDIAARAGVGTATVERVLNGRGGVRPDTTEKVVLAARALGYPRLLPDRHRGLLRVEVLMVRPETTFFRRLSHAFERIAATLNPLVVLQRSFTDEMNPAEIARRIAATGTRRAALIVTVPDHPLIRAAVAGVASSGVPVVNLVNPAADRIGAFVGIDNYAAGRSAARFMARMARRPGPAIALCHPIYRLHRERIRGFSDGIAAHPDSAVHFAWLGFGLDDDARSADLLFHALRRHPDLAGIYNSGGGNAALLEVLRHDPRGQDLFFVGHELTDATGRGLTEGLMDIVLDQAPEAQARRALDVVLHRIGLTDIAPDKSPIRFVTFTADSV